MYEDHFLTLWNVAYTSLTPVVMAIFDKDVDEDKIAIVCDASRVFGGDELTVAVGAVSSSLPSGQEWPILECKAGSRLGSSSVHSAGTYWLLSGSLRDHARCAYPATVLLYGGRLAR